MSLLKSKNKIRLECTCVNISKERWDELMKDVKKTDYNELVKKIQEDIPNLYRELRLDLQIYIKNIHMK